MKAPAWYRDLRADLAEPVTEPVWRGMAVRLVAAGLTAVLAVPFLVLGAWRLAHVVGHNSAGWYVSGDALRRLAFNALLATGFLVGALRLVRRVHRYTSAQRDMWGRVLPRWFREGRWAYGDPLYRALADPYTGPAARRLAAKVVAVSAGIVALAACAILAVVGAVYHEDQVTSYALVGIGAALVMAGLVFYLGAMEGRWGDAILEASVAPTAPEPNAATRAAQDDLALYAVCLVGGALAHWVAPELDLWQAITLVAIAWMGRRTVRAMHTWLAQRRDLQDSTIGAANFAVENGYPVPAAGENFTHYLERTLAEARSTSERNPR